MTDAVDLAIVGLRAEIVLLQKDRDYQAELVSQRFAALDQSITTALAANDKRLTVMNEFRGAMADQAALGVKRTEFETAVEAMRTRFETVIGPINHTLAALGRPNWSLMLGFGSVAVSFAAGVWLVIGLQINSAVTPQAMAIESLRTTETAQMTMLRTLDERTRVVEGSHSSYAAAIAEERMDRGRLHTMLDKVEADASSSRSERKANEARFDAALVEIETQFCASDTVRNLMHATDLRYFAMLWANAHGGERLPTDNALYPVICNRDTRRSLLQ